MQTKQNFRNFRNWLTEFRKNLATLFIFLDFRGRKLAESVRQDVTRKWQGGQVTPRNLGHEKALDVRSILLVNDTTINIVMHKCLIIQYKTFL